ncbi:helix-turn-helix DNA-binding protein [Streptomyces phage Bmoc]|uniref:Helix-turn-helix DNA-binding protein n=1 Tax=Streptomyces phage Bmoc TaxID=2725629 RepID=A0A6M3SYT5_9CAUD|nr:helix-turn-helix DNA-binding protein [Streptomyces phage Bmoc]QJD50819.1 helix-turn-helix DNA-binding protein [Streptomyces phage Bmoc]
MGKEKKPKQRKRPADKYFFLDDVPHKKLQINRGADTLLAWNYIERKRVQYVWSIVKRNMTRAFYGSEVQKMLGRHRNSLYLYTKEEQIRKPFRTYTLDGEFRPGIYLWSEKNILELHELLVQRGYGAKRKDGLPTATRLPSRTELLAMMRNDVVLYTKTRDGNFTPVWQENDW